jgi:hypothetical protein
MPKRRVEPDASAGPATIRGRLGSSLQRQRIQVIPAHVLWEISVPVHLVTKRRNLFAGGLIP